MEKPDEHLGSRVRNKHFICDNRNKTIENIEVQIMNNQNVVSHSKGKYSLNDKGNTSAEAYSTWVIERDQMSLK